MFRVTKTIDFITVACCVISLALAVIQPWRYARLYVPLHEKTYFTLENKSGDWWLRIGDVGGINGFELSLPETDQRKRRLRAELDPQLSVLNWYFAVRSSSPCFLLQTPLYAPAFLFAIWPAVRILKTRKRSSVLAVKNTDEAALANSQTDRISG